MRRGTRRGIGGAAAAAAAVALAAGAGSALAFVRLSTDGGGGTPLAWRTQPIQYAIDPLGSDDVATDASEAAAVRLAFDAWAEAPGVGLAFHEVLFEGRSRAAYDGDNKVLFDENDDTGLFGGASFIVALTTVTFDPRNGAILDADIVFNGRDHAFTTDPTGPEGHAAFDVQAVATHEIGHLLGLDHSGVHDATMTPMVEPAEMRLRSLAPDDVAGARTSYRASGAAFGAIAGRVVLAGGAAGPEGAGVRAAHVVATDVATGVPISATITNGAGDFVLQALPPGDYRVLVEPLDGPLYVTQLQRGAADTGFASAYVGGSLTPAAVPVRAPLGVPTSVGTVAVEDAAGFGISAAFPKTVPQGTARQVFVTSPHGPAALEGATVEVLGGAGIEHEATVTGSGFGVVVDASAPPTAHDIVLRDLTASPPRLAVLAGGLEVVAPAPILLGASRATGAATGGAEIELTGIRFERGARVVFGDEAVPAADTTFTGPERLVVVAPPNEAGAVDIVVINPDGQESRLRQSFAYVGEGGPPAPPPGGGGVVSSGGSSGGSGGCALSSGGRGNGGGLLPLLPLLVCAVSISVAHKATRRPVGSA